MKRIYLAIDDGTEATNFGAYYAEAEIRVLINRVVAFCKETRDIMLKQYEIENEANRILKIIEDLGLK